MLNVYLGLFAAIAVVLLLLLAPVISEWRYERQRRKRAGWWL